jgi:hypothetical protein
MPLRLLVAVQSLLFGVKEEISFTLLTRRGVQEEGAMLSIARCPVLEGSRRKRKEQTARRSCIV